MNIFNTIKANRDYRKNSIAISFYFNLKCQAKKVIPGNFGRNLQVNTNSHPGLPHFTRIEKLLIIILFLTLPIMCYSSIGYEKNIQHNYYYINEINFNRYNHKAFGIKVNQVQKLKSFGILTTDIIK